MIASLTDFVLKHNLVRIIFSKVAATYYSICPIEIDPSGWHSFNMYSLRPIEYDSLSFLIYPD